MSASSVVLSGNDSVLQKVQSGALYCSIALNPDDWTKTGSSAPYIYTATVPLSFPVGLAGDGNAWQRAIRYITYSSPADAYTYFSYANGTNFNNGTATITPRFSSSSASNPSGIIQIHYTFTLAAAKQSISHF